MFLGLKGFLLGLAIAAPVGPIGMLCIRRTLAHGRLIGFVSGLGAATADMCYGAVAALGLTAIRDLILAQQLLLRILGGLFLLYLGVRTFLARPANLTSSSNEGTSRLAAYLSTLGLTLTNPATILSFTFVFAGLRLAEAAQGYVSALALIAGVFLGSATWWLALAGLLGLFRERFTTRWMTWVNRLAGALIFAFGAAALLST